MKDKEKQKVKTICNITEERHQWPRYDILMKSLLFYQSKYKRIIINITKSLSVCLLV